MNRIILNETSYFGAGCRSVIAVEAARRGFKKAFFVTDKDLITVSYTHLWLFINQNEQLEYFLEPGKEFVGFLHAETERG